MLTVIHHNKLCYRTTAKNQLDSSSSFDTTGPYRLVADGQIRTDTDTTKAMAWRLPSTYPTLYVL